MTKKLLLIAIASLFALNLYAFMPSGAEKDQPLTSAMYKTGIKIVDIRTEPEWKQTGIVKDSYTLTFFDEKGKYNTSEFISGLRKIVKPNENFAIICRTGNRTTSVSQFLRQAGFPNVINLTGGVVQAAKNKIPFEKYK